jgi:uncharacterized protein YbjT (DUF2867 family)
MSNKILVTGATGNIGSALIPELTASRADFAVMTSKSGTTIAGVETRHGEFGSVASLMSAFEGIDTLFLLFPLVENKVELARNAAAAAKAAGVKHIVRSSGAGADSTSAFALPKLQGEIDDVLAATGIPTTFVRPNVFMQNYVNYQSQAIRDGTLYAADGGQAQSFVDTRDIAAVVARILGNPAAHASRAYTLTGGEALTGAQVAAAISAAIGKPVKHVSIPTEAAVATMNQWGMPAFIVNVMDSLNQVVSAGYASGVSPDVEIILGRKARTFASFVNENAGAWKVGQVAA